MANAREITRIGQGDVSESFKRFVVGQGSRTRDAWEKIETDTVSCNAAERIVVNFYQHSLTLSMPNSEDKASIGYVADTAFDVNYAFKVRPDGDLPLNTIAGPIVRRNVCNELCTQRCAIVVAREAAAKRAK